MGAYTVTGARNTGSEEFQGITSVSDIGPLTITDSGGDSPGADQAQFGSAGATYTPEPGATALVCSGSLMGCILLRRRRQRYPAAA